MLKRFSAHIRHQRYELKLLELMSKLAWIERAAFGLCLVLSLVFILAAATPQGRTAVRTALFLPQVLPAIPIKPLEWLSGTPARLEMSYALNAGQGIADLYVPARGDSHSAILMFLGVNPAGRDDPRVVGLAEGLARTGVIVMIPWSEAMTQRRIDVDEIDNLVKGFEHLRSLEIVDSDRVGMGGFCVGASLATVAAQDPRIRDHVRFVNFFGGYFNAEDLIKAVVTRSRFYQGKVEPWSPNQLSIDVVTTHLIEGVPDEMERLLLTQVFVDRSRDINGELATLSTEAKAVYRLLSYPSWDEVDNLMNQLSAETLTSVKLVSPSTRIHDLNARALIMHDREDSLVPSEESRRLADAINGARPTYYTEFSFFQHVDPTRPVSVPVYAKEGFKLFLHMYNVIRELS